MPRREISPAILPVHLEPRTIGNLPIESPRFVDPDFIYLRDATNELFVYKSDQFERGSDRPARLLGKVGIMKALVTDNSDKQQPTSVTGYVADLRFITSGDDFMTAPSLEMPADQEDMSSWEEDLRESIPLAAIIFHEDGPKRETTTTGDTRFISAVLHLAKLADELEAENRARQSSRKTAQPKGTRSTQMRANRRK